VIKETFSPSPVNSNEDYEPRKERSGFNAGHIGQGAALHLGKIEIRRGITITIIFLKRSGGRDQNDVRC
jgi:hypothetical protein